MLQRQRPHEARQRELGAQRVQRDSRFAGFLQHYRRGGYSHVRGPGSNHLLRGQPCSVPSSRCHRYERSCLREQPHRRGACAAELVKCRDHQALCLASPPSSTPRLCNGSCHSCWNALSGKLASRRSSRRCQRLRGHLCHLPEAPNALPRALLATEYPCKVLSTKALCNVVSNLELLVLWTVH